MGSVRSWLAWYIPSVILLINNLVYIIFTTHNYRVSKPITFFGFQHNPRNNSQSTTETIRAVGSTPPGSGEHSSGQRGALRAVGSTQINAKLLFRTRTVVLPFSNSCKIGTIRVFQKTSSTSISVSCSCKLALEAAKKSRQGKGIVRGTWKRAHAKAFPAHR